MNFDALTAYIDGLYEKEGIPSSQIVIHKNGEEIYRHAAGYQDVATGEPIRRDALYFMYSCSKVVTVIAAMQQLEQGKFLMFDRVDKYLPEFADIRVASYTPTGKKVLVNPQHALRISHLFTMTGGLDYDWKAPELVATIAGHDGKPTTADVVRAIAQKPLCFHPGTHWQYSLSHDVLARLVEVWSGERFADYVQKHIFDPVGMAHSCYHLTDAIRPKMAAQYRFEKELGKAVDIGLVNGHVPGENYDSGGAGVISCIDDLILLADTMTRMGVTANGTRILSARAVDLLRTDCLDEKTRPDFCWDAMRGYGYGFGVRTMVDPKRGGSLSPVGEFGWGGAAGSYFHADPANGISIIYTQHMLNNKEAIVHPRLRNLVYAALDR